MVDFDVGSLGDTLMLSDLATARSGDKGDHLNIGVVAFDQHGYDLLERRLTCEVVQAYFSWLPTTIVQRFELPKILAFNFLLQNALSGGASRSLRLDTQGKLAGTAMLELEIPTTS